MELTVTAKVKIITDKEADTKLKETMSAYRDACNFVSEYVFKTHDLKQFSLNKALYHSLRDSFNLKSQMAQSVFKTVIARYKTILENQGEWIKPEFKNLQYDLVWNRDYSMVSDCFSVNTLDGRMKFGYCQNGMERYFDKSVYRFGTAKLVYKHKCFFLHIPVTSEVTVCSDPEIRNVVGVDRGINFIAATFDSSQKSVFYKGRPVKEKHAHYKSVRKGLQQVRTHSSRRRLKAIGQRENRWMQDVNHQVSKALVDSNPSHTLFVLEDLTGVRNATERVRTRDRYISVSWSFYDLEQKLEYKALRKGSKVMKVDPRYTSQTCPRCGHVEKENRDKKLHIFKCRCCGYTSNDDRIGAMNLYLKGIGYLSSQVPDTGVEEQCSSALADVNQPTMLHQLT